MQLPVFPLHTVLFPHLPLPLHIFEERYRAMATDLMVDGSPYAGRFVVSMIPRPEGGEAPPSTTSARSARCAPLSIRRRALDSHRGRCARARIAPVEGEARRTASSTPPRSPLRPATVRSR